MGGMRDELEQFRTRMSPDEFQRHLQRRREQARARGGRLIPVRLELLDGTTAYRAVPDLEDVTIFHAFNQPTRTLDPRCRIEWARAARDNPASHRGRQADGMVFRNGQPIGKISVAFEGEERYFKDSDPTNESDRLRMGY